MINIGCHLSSSKGFTAMAENCNKINATAFQYFTRNPRGGKQKKINPTDIENFFEMKKTVNYSSVAHAPYTMNLCSHSEDIRNYSARILKEDIKVCENIPGTYYNFHPGSHTGQGKEKGINQISKVLNDTIESNQNTIVLLETMAGKGTEIGGNFEDIAKIISNIEIKEKIGVCFDTCHVFDAGYDIVNNLESVLENFDKTIGISKLKVVHLNDSKNILGSKKDRHEQLGKGNIGLETIKNIINNKYLKDLVFILETPQENLEGYAKEISLIKSCYESSLNYEK